MRLCPMLAIFLKTLPFFAVIGLGFMAGRQRFFTPEATAYLTKFVFYFALSAMLFGFAANLDVGVVFSSVLTILIAGLREGRMSWGIFRVLAMGLLRNPMIVSVVLGLAWGATGAALPLPVNKFMTMLGAAATPCALFAIGASLAGRSAERMEVAVWLAFAKLVLHPVAVAVMALVVFPVDRYAAGVMIAAAAVPVAGNVFILAQHFGVAPQRVSTSILISTAVSVLTVTAVIALVEGL